MHESGQQPSGKSLLGAMPRLVALAGLLYVAPNIASANVLVTIAEDPGQQWSTLGGTSIFDFNDLGRGYNSNVTWDGVGTFDQMFVGRSSTSFGALDPDTGYNSNFNWNGGRWVETTNLMLNESSSYLGLYWAAGDYNDMISFYDADSLVASYTTSAIVNSAALTGDYYGDPNFNTFGHEPHAFINFYGDDETFWDRIEFTQTSPGGGLETDNITVRQEAFDPEVDSVDDMGVAVSEISGSEVSEFNPTTSTSFTWVPAQAAPGAPTPPIYALMLFAAAFALKDRLRKRAEVA